MACALARTLAPALAACLPLPVSALAVGTSARHEGRAFLDVREGRPPAQPHGSPRARLELRRALGSQGVLDTDPVTGGPRVVARLNGFLSGPAAGDPAAIALGYIRAHEAALGLGDSDLAHLRLVTRHISVDGVTHLTWVQTWRGIPAFDNGVRANVTADGRVVSVLGSPLGGLSASSTRPRVSARAALRTALRDAGARRNGRPVGAAHRVIFGEQGGGRLAWRLSVKAGRAAVYDYVIDARTGRVLRRANKVDFASALVYEYYPGAASGGTQQSQSLDAWLPTGATTLNGNNAHAYLDLNDTGTATEIAPGSVAFSPVSSPSGNCPASGCAWNHLVAGSWSTNEQEAGNQAFYYVNKFHDHLAAAPISFTPAAGNFEGADRVDVEVDDGASTGPDDHHIDNSNFATPSDGQAPTMQLYLFGRYGFSDVNGADDATLVYHEYTHGLSNRLITDDAGVGALNSAQAGAMGEAWSDWYAMDYLAEEGYVSDTDTNGDAQVGAYTDGGQHFIRYQGINCPVGSATGCPGSPNTGAGGFTYADFGHVYSGPEVHADGEIWGETLWDLRQRMLADHPGDGAQRTEMLVTHAMELAPPEPSFLDMRNAILQEDVIAYGGADETAIWDVFAHRGMGWFASTAGGDDTSPVADFSTPPSGGATATVAGHVTDADTNAPVAGAKVGFGGHDTGLGAELSAETDAAGAYAIAGVPAGTYPHLIATAAGYDRAVTGSVAVGGQTTADVSLRRDWAALSGGAEIKDVTGPDYSPWGCGPTKAVDQSYATGWSTTTDQPQTIVLALPQAVDVSSFGVDPAGVCGDDDTAALGSYVVDVSRDGSSWTRSAGGTFGSTDIGRLHGVSAANGGGVRYVRLTMLSSQSAAGSGAQFMDVAEFEVFGVPQGFGQPPGGTGVAPPTGTTTVKPPPAFSVSIAVKPKQKLRTLLRKGLPVQLTCNARCAGAAALARKRKAFGRGARQLLTGGSVRMTVRVNKKRAKKALGRGRRWKVSLRVVVSGPAGRRSFSKTVKLSR